MTFSLKPYLAFSSNTGEFQGSLLLLKTKWIIVINVAEKSLWQLLWTEFQKKEFLKGVVKVCVEIYSTLLSNTYFYMPIGC